MKGKEKKSKTWEGKGDTGRRNLEKQGTEEGEEGSD